MGTAKDEVRKLVEQIPDVSSFEDIQYHVCVREKIQRGLDDMNAGRTVTQEEIEKRMVQWLGK